MTNRPHHDRAAAITTAVLQLTAASSVPEIERRLQVENLLRDELAAVEQQIAAERELP